MWTIRPQTVVAGNTRFEFRAQDEASGCVVLDVHRGDKTLQVTFYRSGYAMRVRELTRPVEAAKRIPDREAGA